MTLLQKTAKHSFNLLIIKQTNITYSIKNKYKKDYKSIIEIFHIKKYTNNAKNCYYRRKFCLII